MFKLNDTIINIENEFTSDEGITYPHLRDPEIRTSLGIVEVPDPEGYDQRFYWGVDIPKDLDQLKQQWIAQTKENTNKSLAQTDWMITRKFERSIDVPEDVIISRNQVIESCNQQEIDITNCETVEELINVLFPQTVVSEE